MTSAKDMVEFKAVSENVRHSNVQITDKFYSNLKANELKSKIQGLGSGGKNADEERLAILLEALLEELKRKS